ncbi:hypothetical protein LWI29_014172 [Acer saccharum]|uniref:Phytocyanin domain-containing protein n=1 Tax=Acer saccharum TaxID=4024 RepID=A0AA39TSD6_ACESA|nr:hypothetical protein LWI29_014172 [Acer saccharum]
MASVKTTALALVLMATATMLSLFQISSAAVYKVGDSAGWTTIGNVDYKTWAATKTFQVGDIIQLRQLSVFVCLYCYVFCFETFLLAHAHIMMHE